MKKRPHAILAKIRAADPVSRSNARQQAVLEKLRAADPLRNKLHPLIAAVARLRHELKLTQQEFADRLGIAIATMVRYENNRVPRGKALSRLEALAAANGFEDLAAIFRTALVEELGALPPSEQGPMVGFRSDDERELVGALLDTLRQEKYAAKANAIRKALEPVVHDRRRRAEEDDAVNAQRNAIAGLLDKGRSPEEAIRLFRIKPEALAEAFFSRGTNVVDAKTHHKKMMGVVELLLKDGWSIRRMADQFGGGDPDEFFNCASDLGAHDAIREYEEEKNAEAR